MLKYLIGRWNPNQSMRRLAASLAVLLLRPFGAVVRGRHFKLSNLFAQLTHLHIVTVSRGCALPLFEAEVPMLLGILHSALAEVDIAEVRQHDRILLVFLQRALKIFRG